jgi:hypothetical protein
MHMHTQRMEWSCAGLQTRVSRKCHSSGRDPSSGSPTARSQTLRSAAPFILDQYRHLRHNPDHDVHTRPICPRVGPRHRHGPNPTEHGHRRSGQRFGNARAELRGEQVVSESGKIELLRDGSTSALCRDGSVYLESSVPMQMILKVLGVAFVLAVTSVLLPFKLPLCDDFPGW